MKKDTYRSIEITAVFLTVVGKLIYDSCCEQKIAVAAAAIFWVLYLIPRACKEEGICKEWGFTGKNFKPAMKWVGIAGVILIGGAIAYGLVCQNAKFNSNILKAIPLYILWGTIQQFIFISLFAGNLQDSQNIKLRKWLIILITSILFLALHTSRMELMIVTFPMAGLCTFLFLKYRNLFPLGIFHGVVGAVFYYFVLNEDPWADLIAQICSQLCD